MRSPRPHRRGRIETCVLLCGTRSLVVPPGLTAGGGLKQAKAEMDDVKLEVPPGLTAGGGLKHAPLGQPTGQDPFPPASPPGAD